jgi:hypothetical protein
MLYYYDILLLLVGPPGWGLGMGLTTPHWKNLLLQIYGGGEDPHRVVRVVPVKKDYYYVVGWLAVTHQTHIWEVFGSNLGQDTRYPDLGLSLFSSVLGNARIVPQLSSTHFYLICLQFIFNLSSYHSILHSLSC